MSNDYRVFISHATEDDQPVSEKIAGNFRQRDIDYFIDHESSQLPDEPDEDTLTSVRNVLIDELNGCHELVLILSVNSVSRPWVFVEVGGVMVRRTVPLTAFNYGVPEEKLRELGIFSILESEEIRLLEEESLSDYFRELQDRIQAKSHA